MKSFLNAFMKRYQNDQGNLNYFKALCDETIEKVYELYGENACRRVNEDGSVTPINRAIMDALMISAIPYSNEKLNSKKNEIRERLLDEINGNKDFRLSTLTSTSDTKVLKFRISFWCNVIDEILK